MSTIKNKYKKNTVIWWSICRPACSNMYMRRIAPYITEDREQLSVDNQEVAHPPLSGYNLSVKHSHGRSLAIFPPQPYHWELMFPSMLCWSTNHTVGSNTPVKEQDINAGRRGRAGREVTKRQSSAGEGSCLEQRLEKMRMWRVL